MGSTASKRGQTNNKGTGIIVRNEQTDDKFQRAISEQETIPVNEITRAKIVVECLKQTDSQEVIRSKNIRDKAVHLKPVKMYLRSAQRNLAFEKQNHRKENMWKPRQMISFSHAVKES
jgi:hypothetical protein